MHAVDRDGPAPGEGGTVKERPVGAMPASPRAAFQHPPTLLPGSGDRAWKLFSRAYFIGVFIFLTENRN